MRNRIGQTQSAQIGLARAIPTPSTARVFNRAPRVAPGVTAPTPTSVSTMGVVPIAGEMLQAPRETDGLPYSGTGPRRMR
jgi:hypothetical protein